MPSLTLKIIFFPFGAPRYISIIWPHQAGRFYFLSQLTVFRDQVPTYLLGLITNHYLLHSSHTDLLLVPEHTKAVPAFKPLLLLLLLPRIPFPRSLDVPSFYSNLSLNDVPQRASHSHLSPITLFHFYLWFLSVPEVIFKNVSVYWFVVYLLLSRMQTL